MASWVTPITWVNGAVTAATMNAEVRDHDNWLKGWADNTTNSTAADSGTATYFAIKRTSTGQVAYRTNYGADTDYRWRVNSDGGMDYGPGTGTRSYGFTVVSTSELKFDGARLTLSRGTNGDDYLAMQQTADSNYRIRLDTISTTGQPRIAVGAGSGATDTFLQRNGVGQWRFPSGTSVDYQATAGGDVVVSVQVGTETFPRARLLGSGEYKIGDGTNSPDANLYRSANSTLKTDGHFIVADGVQTFVESVGAMTDGRFVTGPGNGTIAINSSGATPRICVRIGGSWFGVNTTAGG